MRANELCASAACWCVLLQRRRGAGPTTIGITRPSEGQILQSGGCRTTERGNQRRRGANAGSAGSNRQRGNTTRARCRSRAIERVAGGIFHQVRGSSCSTAMRRVGSGANGHLAIVKAVFNSGLLRTRLPHHAGDLRLRHVRLVLGNCDSSQDTNDRHNDHQFDKGETLLHVTCDQTTVHSKTPGWLVEPGNQARSAVSSAASVPPVREATSPWK
jgi:hypothetical protein